MGQSGAWMGARLGDRVDQGAMVPVLRCCAVVVLASAAVHLPSSPTAVADTSGPVISVATYNVCKKLCGRGGFAWQHRRHAVVRNIVASGAQVVAVQEAAGTVRWIAARLAGHGYVLANSRTDGCGRGCTRDSFVFYRSDAFEPLPVRPRAGTARLSAVSGVRWTGSYDRRWAWAYLRQRATGQPVLVASVHLPNEKTRLGERLRRAAARGLVAHLEAHRQSRGLPPLTTVIAGDLNSFGRRQPNGAHRVIRTTGFTDAYTAPSRTHARVATINVTRKHRDPFPARPFRSDSPARLDYVFVARGRPLTYEVFLKLRGGRFDNRYRGSDHNLVLASLHLGE